jgi:hypothetical protein
LEYNSGTRKIILKFPVLIEGEGGIQEMAECFFEFNIQFSLLYTRAQKMN